VGKILCSSRPPQQKKLSIWNQIFLKSESGEESEKNTTGLELFEMLFFDSRFVG